MAEPNPDIAAERLEQIADEPASATSDGQTAVNQSIPDLIELHRYTSSRKAVANGRSAWGAVRMAKGTPPGAV